jgi:antitoxin HicB
MRNLDQYPFEVRALAPDEGGGFLITFPDFAECIADGETVE